MQWFDANGRPPDWLDSGQKRLACWIRGDGGPDLYLMFNPETEAADFVLPESAPPGSWRVAIDTAQSPVGDDEAMEHGAGLVTGAVHRLASRSSAVLVSGR